MNKIVYLIIYITLISAFVYFVSVNSSTSTSSSSTYNIEKYLNYFQITSIPTDAYKGLGSYSSSSSKYFIEHDESFFKDILDKNVSKSSNTSLANFKDINLQNYNLTSLRSLLTKYIENLFNKEIASENNLYYVANLNILSSKKLDDKYYIVAEFILHRELKAYGVSLSMSFFITESSNQTEYDTYKIVGFVFEDKIHMIRASNYNEDIPLSQQIDNQIIGKRDSISEKKAICKYLGDLKKYRNIDNTYGCDGT